MASDSTLDEVPDTPAHARHFGRVSSGKSQSPFPQVRCLSLAEVGSHAIVDAVFARGHASEQALLWSARGSSEPDMRVMTDRNFRSLNWWVALTPRRAQVLARLAAGYFTQPSRRLPDGSYLVTVRPKG